MSLKVYEAYRTKPGTDIWKLTQDIRAKALTYAKRKILDFYNSSLERARSDVLAREEFFGKDAKPGDVNILGMSRWLTLEYRKQSTSYERDAFDLSVAVSFRKYGQRWFLITYCDRCSIVSGALDFLAKHPSLEEYGYWNNTDKPDEVSNREWAQRRRVWNALTEEPRWNDQLVLEVVSYQGFHTIDPMIDEILRKQRENNK